jgi:EmrB/QacA subfamily drug resistance transporter
MSEPGQGRSIAGAEEAEQRRQRMILITCCLALFISTLDNTVANVALPDIGRDFGTSTTALQWVVDSYLVVRGCLLLSAGAAGDRWGRRRVFQIGLATFGVGSLLCSLAPSVDLLIMFRVLQALGGCFLVPSSLALIADAYPDRGERARAIGIWSATTAASTGLGLPLGGLLVDYLGWRSVFWINLPIVAVAIWLATRYASEGRRDPSRRLDVPGQGVVAVLLVTLTSGFIQASSSGWHSPFVLALFGVAVVSLVGFIRLELRVRQPLLDPRLFRSRPFAGAAAVAVTAYVVYAGFLFVNTLYLQDVLGYSPLRAGLLVAPSTVGTVVLAPLSGRMTSSSGPRRPVMIASLLLLAGCGLLATAATADPVVPLLIAGYVLLGCGAGLVNTPITDAAVAGLPAERSGVAGAITSTFRQVGNSLGVALLGTVFVSGASATSGLRTAYMTAGGFAAVTLAVALVTFRRPAGQPGA